MVQVYHKKINISLYIYIFFDFKCYTGIGFGYCQVLIIQKDQVLWRAAPFMIKMYTTTSQEANIPGHKIADAP